MEFSGKSTWYILDNNPIIKELKFVAHFEDKKEFALEIFNNQGEELLFNR